MNNIKLTAKLLGAFVIVALIAGVVGAVGYFTLVNVTNTYDHIVEEQMPGIKELGALGQAQGSVLASERGLFLNDLIADRTVRQEQYDSIESAWQTIDASWASYEALKRTTEEERIWQEFAPVWNQWKTNHEKAMQLLKERDSLIDAGQAFGDPEVDRLDAEAWTASVAARENFEASALLLSELMSTNHNAALAADQAADAQAISAEVTILVTIAIAVVIATGFGIVLSRNITRPMEQAVYMIQEMNRGHLGERLNLNRRDEVGVLAQTMDAFAETLQTEIVGAMQKVAVGNLKFTVTVRDEQDEKIMFEIALGLEETNFRDSTPNRSDLVFIARTLFEKKVFNTSRFKQDLSIYACNSLFDEFRLHSETSFVNPINESLSLQLSFIDDYNTNPPPDIKDNDTRLISSLVYSF